MTVPSLVTDLKTVLHKASPIFVFLAPSQANSTAKAMTLRSEANSSNLHFLGFCALK